MKLIKKENLHRFIDTINVSKHIANHILGNDHTSGHRKIVGGAVMIAGVTFSHLAFYDYNIAFKIVADAVGYSIHAIGFIPFLKEIEKK